MIRKAFLAMSAIAVAHNAQAQNPESSIFLASLPPSPSPAAVQKILKAGTMMSAFGYTIARQGVLQQVMQIINNDNLDIIRLRHSYLAERDLYQSAQSKLAFESDSPEDCILNTIGKSRKNNNYEAIRWACVHRYINAAIPESISIDPKSFINATLQFSPTLAAFPDPIQQEVRIELENNSSYKLILADIVIEDLKTKKYYSYRALASFPVDPYATGTFESDTILPVNSAADFNSQYTWYFKDILGVAK